MNRARWFMVVLAFVAATPLVARADDYVGSTTTTATTSTTSSVAGITATSSSPTTAAVQGIQVTKPAAEVGGLALTGADIAEMTAIAFAFVLVGSVLVRRARRRPVA